MTKKTSGRSIGRRDFLKLVGTTGVVLAGSKINSGKLWAAPPAAAVKAKEEAKTGYQMAAVKNGTPAQMFDKAMEAIGDLKTRIKPGSKVVVKPNIGWDVSPQKAANTNPELIGHIVKRCKEAGAGEVYVFDHTCDEEKSCWKTSGIGPEVTKNGGKLVTGDDENDYKEVNFKNAKILKKVKIHKLILDSDYFINVPVLKSHGSGRVTIAMKNLMGIIWDRRLWHREDLHYCIAEFASLLKPNLNVIDAYRVMMKNGPRGRSENDVAMYKSLIAGEDILAVDVAATKLFGANIADVRYLNLGKELKVGNFDLDKMKIARIKL